MKFNIKTVKLVRLVILCSGALAFTTSAFPIGFSADSFYASTNVARNEDGIGGVSSFTSEVPFTDVLLASIDHNGTEFDGSDDLEAYQNWAVNNVGDSIRLNGFSHNSIYGTGGLYSENYAEFNFTLTEELHLGFVTYYEGFEEGVYETLLVSELTNSFGDVIFSNFDQLFDTTGYPFVSQIGSPGPFSSLNYMLGNLGPGSYSFKSKMLMRNLASLALEPLGGFVDGFTELEFSALSPPPAVPDSGSSLILLTIGLGGALSLRRLRGILLSKFVSGVSK